MIKNLYQKTTSLFRPWGSDEPDKQYFQLGLSALGGIVLGLSVWVALQSQSSIQRAYGTIPGIEVRVQSQPVASEVSADFGRKELSVPSLKDNQAQPHTESQAKDQATSKPFQLNAIKVLPHDLSKPGLAFVVVDFGLSDSATNLVLEKLPAKSSIIVPAGVNIEKFSSQAQARGLEIWAGLAMEPDDYPVNDSGPLTIFQNADATTNRTRLIKTITSITSAAGVAAIMPSPLFKSGPDIDLIAGTIFEKGYGLLTLPAPDAAALAKNSKMPLAYPDFWLDDNTSTPQAQLQKAQDLAKQQGYAIVLLHPYPESLDVVSTWASKATDAGFSILPVSAIAERVSHE